MTECRSAYSQEISVGSTKSILDTHITYDSYHYRQGDPCATLKWYSPWNHDDRWEACQRVGEYTDYYNPNCESEYYYIEPKSFDSSSITLDYHHCIDLADDALFFDPNYIFISGSDELLQRRIVSHGLALEWSGTYAADRKSAVISRLMRDGWHREHNVTLCRDACYWRGTCDCIDFQGRGRRHHRPCVHLIEMFTNLTSNPPSC